MTYRMDTTQKRRNDVQDAIYRRAIRRGVVVSVFLHLLLLFIFGLRPSDIPTDAAEGPREGDTEPAGGAMQAMAVRIRPPTPIIRPPEPIIPPELDLELEEVVLDEIEMPQLDFQGIRGIEGRTDATGRGAGGTGDEGPLRLLPPVPRGMFMAPANPPRELRGRTMEVRVFVDETGRVVADSTRLLPPSSNNDYNQRIKDLSAQWRFEAARRGTQVEAAWFSYTLTFHQ